MEIAIDSWLKRAEQKFYRPFGFPPVSQATEN